MKSSLIIFVLFVSLLTITWARPNELAAAVAYVYEDYEDMAEVYEAIAEVVEEESSCTDKNGYTHQHGEAFIEGENICLCMNGEYSSRCWSKYSQDGKIYEALAAIMEQESSCTDKNGYTHRHGEAFYEGEDICLCMIGEYLNLCWSNMQTESGSVEGLLRIIMSRFYIYSGIINALFTNLS